MRINIIENWNVKSKKDKSRENISIPYAYVVDGGKNSKKKVKFTKQFKINVKKGEESAFHNRRYILEFEGVCSSAEVELNGTSIGKHKGGFLPFSFDVTSIIQKNINKVIRLVVTLESDPDDNILGMVKTNEYRYENYVGIIRDVWLNIVEPECFTKIYTETECHDNCFVYQEKVTEGSKDKYFLCAKCQVNFVESLNDMYIVATLADSGKNVISRTKVKYNSALYDNGFVVKVPVEDAILWSPEFPYMYYMRLELYAKNMATGDFDLVDQRVYKRGIREFEVKDGKFYVNGNETKIKGACHHQTYPFIGMVTSRRAEFREIIKLKNAGFNTVRLVNYPASKEFYEACDTLGMLVINCVPNNGKLNTSKDNAAFRENVKNTFSELAYRDRNNTSVAMWEVTIGRFTAEQGLPNELIKDCMAAVTDAFPEGQKPLFVGDTTHREKSSIAELGLDVAYCYYNEETKTQEIVEGVGANLIGSFGADGYKLDKKDKKIPTEQKMAEQAWAYQYIANQNATVNGTIGAIISQDIDYSNGKEKMIMGIMNEYRLPKTAYYFFQSQDENAKPMVYIPHPMLATLVDNMQVYTNCEKINIYFDNVDQGSYEVKKGITTPYVASSKEPYSDFIKKSLNVGNNENLPHPPICIANSLKNVDKREIRIDALNNNEVVSRMIVVNNDKPYKLRIFVDYGGIALANDERDFVFVHVALVDEKGNIVSRDGERITLSAKGGEIVNYSESKTTAGVSSYIVRAFQGTDKVLLKAISKSKGDIKETYARIIVKP